MIVLLLLAQSCAPAPQSNQVSTAVAGTLTALPMPTAVLPNSSDSVPPKKKAAEPPASSESIAAPTLQPGEIAPYPDAPLCPDNGDVHDDSVFHTLWDAKRGCHYDHEHGQNPFTPEVAATFPGFDLRALLGSVGVGHTNPSSPMENTMKHGGFKWNVQLTHPGGCQGFESAETGVNGSVIEYHGFGNYAVEAEARIHSTAALLRQCRADNPTDYGYIFVIQLQDYGQRITPYQGEVLAFPNQPDPGYPSPNGPYLSFNCIDTVTHNPQCRASLEQAQTSDASTNWTSKPTGAGYSTTPGIFRLLWRATDTYQNLDWNDQEYPYTFLWLCTNDGGATYNPVGCKYNNTTTQVQEIAGTIPPSWDNLAGWDSDPRSGRVTATGFIDGAGDINKSCTAPSTDCYPIKLEQAFTGTYGSVLVFTKGKGKNIVPINPERDIYFCNGQVCSEDDPGATPSGWVGPNN
jgi:hypothetical protein